MAERQSESEDAIGFDTTRAGRAGPTRRVAGAAMCRLGFDPSGDAA